MVSALLRAFAAFLVANSSIARATKFTSTALLISDASSGPIPKAEAKESETACPMAVDKALISSLLNVTKLAFSTSSCPFTPPSFDAITASATASFKA